MIFNDELFTSGLECLFLPSRSSDSVRSCHFNSIAKWRDTSWRVSVSHFFILIFSLVNAAVQFNRRLFLGLITPWKCSLQINGMPPPNLIFHHYGGGVDWPPLATAHFVYLTILLWRGFRDRCHYLMLRNCAPQWLKTCSVGRQTIKSIVPCICMLYNQNSVRYTCTA